LDVGPLELGDFLGILLLNLIYLTTSHSVFDFLIYDAAAIGAIFAATDSVCTLQV